MEKRTIKLMFDFLQGPIWISDIATGQPLTGVSIVDNDDVLPATNLKCLELYSNCYEFDVGDQPCVFNTETAIKNKKEILGLLAQINERLAEINDGSFVVEDLATKEIESW